MVNTILPLCSSQYLQCNMSFHVLAVFSNKSYNADNDNLEPPASLADTHTSQGSRVEENSFKKVKECRTIMLYATGKRITTHGGQ